MAEDVTRRGVTIVSGAAVIISVAGVPRTLAIGADECSVIEAMNTVEQNHRPGLITLYYNGRNWLLYDDQQPRFLMR